MRTFNRAYTLAAALAALLAPLSADARSRTAFDQMPGRAGYHANLPVPRAVRVRAGRGGGGCYSAIVQREAARFGVSAATIQSIIRAESSCNPGAVSRKGAIGLMQIMPATARGMGLKNTGALYNPATNIHYGVMYFAQQKRRFGTRGGLAAYNAGPARIKNGKWRQIKETRNYVKKNGY